MTGLKILIFGLPGTGKTTLARSLIKLFKCPVKFLNADEVRTEFDWKKLEKRWRYNNASTYGQSTRIV